ncbi:MAG: protoporphyrinogen/coproporphyrinogen oxidase [Acidimicrobiales bacterium]
MTDTRSSITIVGGGPCGLAAALALARRGVAVDLVERSERLGGMAASIDVGGIRVDLGSHRLHPARSERVGALLDDLLGDDLQVRPRNGRLRLHDRWLHFPLRFGELLTALPPRAAAAAAFDLIGTMLPGRSTATAASYADVVRRGLGPSALSTFHGPMAEKLWGVPPEQLSAELAHKRVSVRSPLALLRTLAKGDDERVFLSPRRGYGQIVDSLADAAVAAGATIRTGVGVERVVADETAPTVRLDDGTELHPNRVLWTAPPDALLRAVDRAAAPDGVPHRALVLVFLVVPETQYLDVDAHYVPGLDVAFSRLSEPRNYRDGDDPEGRTVLCAEVPCTVGDETWAADDVALGDLVLAGMEACGLRRPEVGDVVIERLPAVYPVIGVGEEEARRETIARAEAAPGTTLLGRHGLVVPDNLHHVLEMGLTAADCVALHSGDAAADGRSSWDNAAWQSARARFDDFVVED